MPSQKKSLLRENWNDTDRIICNNIVMTICIQKRNVSGSKCNSQKNDKYCNVLQNKKNNSDVYSDTWVMIKIL